MNNNVNVYQIIKKAKMEELGKGLQCEWPNIIFGCVVLCSACQTYNILPNILLFIWLIFNALQQSPNEVVNSSVGWGCDEDFGVVNSVARSIEEIQEVLFIQIKRILLWWIALEE
uniref:Uncharacterized protein n=1 Tax=Romanomermis culicivorax TaxID=13658 RepID=A0A915J1D0_ROMCU